MKLNLNRFLKAAVDGSKDFMNKNGYIVLGIGAMVGLAGSIILTYRMRPKMDHMLAEQKEKMNEVEQSDMPEEEKEAVKKDITKETIVKGIKIAGSTATCALVTAGCMGGAIAHASNKIDGLMNTVRIGDIAYNQLYQATKDEVGEEKAEEIKMKAYEKDLRSRGLLVTDSDGELMVTPDGFIDTGNGNDLFYCAVSGRLFKCDEDTMIRAMNIVNDKYNHKPEGKRRIEYNEYGKLIGLPHCIIANDKAWPDQIRLHLTNTMKWGKHAVTIMDFETRPITLLHR